MPLRGSKMKQLTRSFAYVILSALLAPGGTAASKQPFSLTIAAPKDPVKAGVELHVLATVTNTSSRSLTFSTSLGVVPVDDVFYKINVRDEHGRVAPPSANLRNRNKLVPTFWGSITSRTLGPGDSFVEQVTVTRMYDLSQPGIYTISVARHVPPDFVPQGQKLGKDFVQSNTITVTVVQ